jgi:hypothetical protein
VSALVTILDANRKAQSVSTSINNAFFAFENLTRLLRTGLYYHCGDDGGSKTTNRMLVNDCASSPPVSTDGESAISFIDDRSKLVRIWLDSSSGTGVVMEQVDTETPYGLTSADFDVSKLMFYVSGSVPGVADGKQPKTTIVLEGITNAGTPEKSELHLQSTVTQRTIDI